HNVFRLCKLIITGMSIIPAIATICIIRLTPRISKEYAGLLILLIINATVFDVYSQFIFDPQYIMPYLCVYREAPLLHIPLSPAWGFIIWVMLVALNVPLYGACYMYRHQLILPPYSSLKLNPKVFIAAVIAIAVLSLSYGFPYSVSFEISMQTKM
ncbi:hypothetical protein PENTCL1PPCAC_14289, partial [Pristionchus entomophagus]